MKAVVPALDVGDLSETLNVLHTEKREVRCFIDIEFVRGWERERCCWCWTCRGGCLWEEAGGNSQIFPRVQSKRFHNSVMEMNCNAESLVRGHGGGEPLLERRLVVAVLLLAGVIVTQNQKFVLHQESICECIQSSVVIYNVFDHPLGDQGAPFRT
jgi:hypothetical protein